MRSLRLSTICSATLLATATLSHATLVGLNTDPGGTAWERGTAGNAYAIWDTFPNVANNLAFSSDAPDQSDSVTNPFLNQSVVATNFGQGAGIYTTKTSDPATAPTGTDGDIFFPGGNGVNFTLTGTVLFEIHGFSVQIKRPGSLLTLNDANGFAPKLSIDGGNLLNADYVVTTSGSGDTSSDAGTYSVTTYYWSPQLAGATGSSFQLQFGRNPSQRTIDTIAVDMSNSAPVPEPSSLALLGVAAVGGLILKRRRKVA